MLQGRSLLKSFGCPSRARRAYKEEAVAHDALIFPQPRSRLAPPKNVRSCSVHDNILYVMAICVALLKRLHLTQRANSPTTLLLSLHTLLNIEAWFVKRLS